jgi:hypothetical protein
MPHKYLNHLVEIDTNHGGRYDYTQTTIDGLPWKTEQAIAKDGFLDYADFSNAYFVLTEKAYDLLNDHGIKHSRTSHHRYTNKGE